MILFIAREIRKVSSVPLPYLIACTCCRSCRTTWTLSKCILPWRFPGAPIDFSALSPATRSGGQYLSLGQYDLDGATHSRRIRPLISVFRVPQALNMQVHRACDGLTALRQQLGEAQQMTSTANLRVLRLFHARQTVRRLNTLLTMLQAVSQTQATLQLLLATSDYVGALDLIATTQDVLRTDLRDLVCVRFVDSIHLRMLFSS